MPVYLRPSSIVFGHIPGGLARFVPCQLQRISAGLGTQYGHGLTPKLRESGDLFVIEAFWELFGYPDGVVADLAVGSSLDGYFTLQVEL